MIKFDKLFGILFVNFVIGVGLGYLLQNTILPIIQIPLFSATFTIGSTILESGKWLDK